MMEQSKEREAFEAWMRRDKPDMPLYRRDMAGSERFGQYCSMLIEDQWQAWQARAALQAGGQPVAFNERASVWKVQNPETGYVWFTEAREQALQEARSGKTVTGFGGALAAPAPVAEPAAREGDCKCRRLGDWNGEHHPLCDASQPAEPVKPDECAQDVYQHGVSIGLFDIPKATANAICAGIAAATGARVDWHYIAGRVHMKAMANSAAPAQPDRQGVALSDARTRGFEDCIDAIRGAIAFGQQNTNTPPDGHWLSEFWNLGRRLTAESRLTDEEIIAIARKECPPFPWGIGTTREIFLQAVRAILPSASSLQDAVLSERKAFEAHVKTMEGYPFAGAFLNLMWKAWQARASSSRAEVEKNAARYLAIKPYLRIDDIGDDEYVYGLMVESEGLEQDAANAIAWGREIDGSVDAAIDALAAAEAPNGRDGK